MVWAEHRLAYLSYKGPGSTSYRLRALQYLTLLLQGERSHMQLGMAVLQVNPIAKSGSSWYSVQEPHSAGLWRRASIACRAEQAWGLERSRACCGRNSLPGQEAWVCEKWEPVKAWGAHMKPKTRWSPYLLLKLGKPTQSKGVGNSIFCHRTFRVPPRPCLRSWHSGDSKLGLALCKPPCLFPVLSPGLWR